MRRLPRRLLPLALVLLLLGLPVPAAANPAGWADFEPLSGSSRDYTTTMTQQATGFPVAEVVSTSVGGAGTGLQTGASTFLGPQTAPGEVCGSSQGQGYLNLRPSGLSAAPPSVTTYTFERRHRRHRRGSHRRRARLPDHLQLLSARTLAETQLQRTRQRRAGSAQLGSRHPHPHRQRRGP